MKTRQDWEKIEEKTLAPYAVKSKEHLGRKYPEKEHPLRTAFQRDRDRIIHSTAFRRLEYKTQVFIYHEGDYYRNRLTHTIEVQQIARSIARNLGVNEDLVEAISLAHDIGHTPFGHKGEQALNEIMSGFGKKFEHNSHGLRVVDILEVRYPQFEGLNLTYEVREGIVKHKTSYDSPEVKEFTEHISPSIEAQIVNVADEIAYTSHDLDDGLKSGILEEKYLSGLKIWNTVVEKAKRCSDVQIFRTTVVRTLINLLVEDLIETSEKKIQEKKIRSVEEARKNEPVIQFSSQINKQYDELKKVLFEKMYNHYRVIRMAEKASRIIKDLFNAYYKEPRQIPPQACRRMGREPIEQIISDYIAGMTDRFAQEEHRKLFDPHSTV
ncbi:MAG: deoxyguanosinetriphosphate triphosphohydrolase [Candidatus Omnitrophica bacterium]|nr:deoxyguanosinetriphosphate triphosphohydrolase [Candidatus Omnitrophota bacterium]MCM8816862.1 deoxyguanosinetriphosphate triphosphohydrolase [Candidatus Omnitrophota bacterium]